MTYPPIGGPTGDPADEVERTLGLLPDRLPLAPGERYVTILDERVAWPARVVASRYLRVGLRADVARAFCDWHEAWLLQQERRHGVTRYDHRDVESDHVYYVDDYPRRHDEGPVVYRLVWDYDGDVTAPRPPTGDPELDERLEYLLVVERFTARAADEPCVWLGADDWAWELADDPADDPTGC